MAKSPSNYPGGIIDVFKESKIFEMNITNVKKQGEVTCDIVLLVHVRTTALAEKL